MPDFWFLSFLSEPWFVVPWYVIGLGGAVWVVHDTRTTNPGVNTAVAWAWPVIVVFFSLIGLALYRWASRPPHIDDVEDDRKAEVFSEYASTPGRKVAGSVIHCVGGDGLGIISAMVAARIVGLSFWGEFWLEYLVGFAFGLFIFQYKAMRSMTDSAGEALWMGGRAEFFSMITVMAGLGAVMGFVTPLTVGHQPPPQTWSFWGFAALGLLVGYVVTFPMNWLLVDMGWKEGQG